MARIEAVVRTMRVIPGFNGRYSISEDGKTVINTFTGVRLKSFKTEAGYLRIALTFEGAQKIFYVHRLVALTYLPASEFKIVNHKDGNKSNNHFLNLEWCTHTHNHKHAFTTGLRRAKQGQESPFSKLTEKDVRKIRRLFLQGKSVSDLVKRFKMSKGCISAIVKNQSWKSLL